MNVGGGGILSLSECSREQIAICQTHQQGVIYIYHWVLENSDPQ